MFNSSSSPTPLQAARHPMVRWHSAAVISHEDPGPLLRFLGRVLVSSSCELQTPVQSGVGTSVAPSQRACGIQVGLFRDGASFVSSATSSSCESGPTVGLPSSVAAAALPHCACGARIPIASSVWLIPAAPGRLLSLSTDAGDVRVGDNERAFRGLRCRACTILRRWLLSEVADWVTSSHAHLKRPSDTDQVSDDDAPMRVCFHSHFSIDTSRSPSLTLDEIYHPLTRAPRCPAHERFGRMQRPLWRKRPATLLGCGVPSTRGGLNRRAEHKTRKAAPHRFGRRAFEK